MLCRAMANVMPVPVPESLSAPMKVAIPSGKLWMAMARADMTPSFLRAAAFPDCSESCIISVAAVLAFRVSPVASCGFSYSGTRKSIRVIRPMPPKNARSTHTLALSSPADPAALWASGYSSASEMNIITPAERPSAAARKLLLNLLRNNIIAPPSPVAAPASSVSVSA